MWGDRARDRRALSQDEIARLIGAEGLGTPEPTPAEPHEEPERDGPGDGSARSDPRIERREHPTA